ncbi:TetR/AcrR family transcriptional regulator [Microbacterium rhizomatis]|uniref:TetR family transcriptional regulator n=1 Tax=Microbacterium rhizomatis TaxID=1631477 RepID=A0A5J5J7C8_9MICO|nr:TetR/AcrR family transcriptional regulator [Microbacterium rhizomatis]KAA9110778.1 TetR family transcriptional regulator [Microbacterium rhizomatis]
MIPVTRSGRPRASSREVLAEAACELFLERGYEATSVADITSRAGVSRSSFFNYFSSKGDVLWAAFDERIAALIEKLEADTGSDAASAVRSGIAAIGDDLEPESLALAIANATAMGIELELERESAMRRARIASAVAARLRRGGDDALRAEVLAAAYAGAVLAAVERWAHEGPGRTALSGVLDRALAVVATLPTAAS